MKITIDLPGGGKIKLERQPMSSDRFSDLLFLLICLGGVAALLLLPLVLSASMR